MPRAWGKGALPNSQIVEGKVICSVTRTVGFYYRAINLYHFQQEEQRHLLQSSANAGK